jgi:hypothetical protein
VSLPVASFVTLSGRDGTNEVRMSLPAIAPSRYHRQNRQRPLTLLKLVRSRSNGNYESRASEDVLRGVGQGRAAVSTIALRATVDHGLCGRRPTARQEKTSLLA